MKITLLQSYYMHTYYFKAITYGKTDYFYPLYFTFMKYTYLFCSTICHLIFSR
ncbi:hypothetical protein PUN28_006442 [Cardiocondyla obscurior]|uniref:Uncharacterized protein n=1 Tax=Cardiocondyla obscurior TaxID=286306 RepID=A0AAW2GDY3_9HYME